MTFESGAPRGEEELVALTRILAWAFGGDTLGTRLWLDRSGLENVRVARRGAETVGGLMEIPMGQWFGGRPVPMLGIAGVGVLPEARGEGVALALMLDALRSARERGFALSTLYPAAVALYRAAGYELAGSRFLHKAVLRTLPTERGPLRVAALDAGATHEVEALYRASAAERPGYLDRGPYVWRRVRENRQGEPYQGLGVYGPSGLEGYVYLSQRGPDDQRELVIHDFVAMTSSAATRLLALFADHRSTMKSLVLAGAAPSPLLLAPTELLFRVELGETWMLRVVDPGAALTARGYPELESSVDLELTDRSLPQNSGRYRLEVSGGRAQVTRGGSGAVALDERALAALYTGFFSPALLARSASLAGDAASLVRLASLFAGPPPALGDFF
jgi:predicted acetyltransferase